MPEWTDKKTLLKNLSQSLADLADFHGMTLSDAQKTVRELYARRALKDACGNQCEAAVALHIHRNTLGRIIDETGIRPHSYRIRRRPRSV